MLRGFLGSGRDGRSILRPSGGTPYDWTPARVARLNLSNDTLAITCLVATNELVEADGTQLGLSFAYTEANLSEFGRCTLNITAAGGPTILNLNGAGMEVLSLHGFLQFQTNLTDFQMDGSKFAGDVSQLQFPSLVDTIDITGLTGGARYGRGGSLKRLSALASADLTNNGWTSDEVDRALVDLDESGCTVATIHIETNAVPSAVGLAAKASLEGRTCTVHVDS